MSDKIIRIATRKSPLALWQANYIGQQLQHHWPSLRIELIAMTTSGDRFLKDKLQAIGGKGLFVKELEEALLDNRADFAVHSMKDLPAALPDGLLLSAICKRDNPFDVLISPQHQTLESLPEGSVVGTASLRRQSQLQALRPDLQIKPLRGNINTRISKLQTGEYQAIVLAAAGLERMNLASLISQRLSDEIMLPACGQGALGIECRREDDAIKTLLAPLNDRLSATCVQVERRVNAQLGGNCHVPLAVYCKALNGRQLNLRAKVLKLDGQQVIADERSGDLTQAMALADACAQSLLAQGAQQLLDLQS